MCRSVVDVDAMCVVISYFTYPASHRSFSVSRTSIFSSILSPLLTLPFFKQKLTSSTSPIDTTSLIKMQVLALERDKSLRSSRLKTIAKRIDHLERAYRVSEMPLLEEDLKVQQGVDKEVWIQRGVELREEGKRRWEEEKEMKERLGRMRGVWEERKSTLLKRKGEEFALRREKAQRKIETEKAKRLDEFLKRQAEARATAEREAARVAQIAAEEQALLERQEEERLRKEAEEQELREKEEQERTDKEESEKAEKEREEREKEEKRKEREKERQKANEQARLQMEREEEAENRRAQRALERAQEKEREKELARGPERKSIFGNAQPVSTSTNGDGPAAATEVWRRRAAADSTPSGTPASSVPGTPTRSHGFGGTRSSAAVDVLTRSESPTPAAGAETGVGMASAKFRAGGWRARAEARKKGEELPPTGAPTPTSAAATTGTGGGIGSNTPSRTASPAPGPEDDGFTVVGGEKKNVWKPKAWRGGSGLRGR
ncbi:hypothetical protein J3R30DRAFT_2423630 [Lentinula aciculospora]|uniref:Uncharacterized protein n=1 Tax=Lentinula aciculospora TaxID=153920 RepID=A0A9W9DQI7_9AGAR|nr:hypothetical protein J3R30DRAFT_2423630 [Lentinula aciculospora]